MNRAAIPSQAIPGSPQDSGNTEHLAQLFHENLEHMGSRADHHKVSCCVDSCSTSHKDQRAKDELSEHSGLIPEVNSDRRYQKDHERQKRDTDQKRPNTGLSKRCIPALTPWK